MSIDLDDGKIQSQNFELKVGTAKDDNSIIITSNNEFKPLRIGKKFSVDWDGTVDATGFKLTGTHKEEGEEGEDNINNIILDSNASKYPLKIGDNFKVKWDGTVKATGFDISTGITGKDDSIMITSDSNEDYPL
jgi:hypothetical protein